MNNTLKVVNLYTDGACSGNPGPGGYGAILVYGEREKEISKGYSVTTNNRMELLAVIEGLRLLKYKCIVNVYSDSKYVVNAINLGWLENWVKKDFKRGTANPVKNIDLWLQLLDEMNKHIVTFYWVKGHDGNEYNERCDKLAVDAYKKLQK